MSKRTLLLLKLALETESAESNNPNNGFQNAKNLVNNEGSTNILHEKNSEANDENGFKDIEDLNNSREQAATSAETEKKSEVIDENYLQAIEFMRPEIIEDKSLASISVDGKTEAGDKLLVTQRIVDYSSSENDFSADDYDEDPSFEPNKETQFHISDSDEDLGNVPLKKPTRWRKRDPSSWKVNVTKTKRSECLPYHNKKKECTPKLPKQVNCTQCRFKCTDNFTEEERNRLCRTYWSLADYKRQKDFLIKSIETSTPKRRKVDETSTSARSLSKVYYLENNRGRFRVCANFFEKTLCISNGPINTAIKGKGSAGCFEEIDKRGKKIPGNKTNEEQMALVKQHIESFPCMEAHYVRQSSQRKYLDSKLSVLKMYEMYTDFCKERNVDAISEFTYRRIFSTSYNLSFFKPKKDQCPTCNKYDVASADKKQEMHSEYSLHIARKNECNEAKINDKLKAKNDKSFITANFDLQSVLQIPFSSVSQFYYSRKICVYNLTIYEGDGSNAYCYSWNELNGKRGSSEIGSILLKYIKQLPSTVNEISLFSDTCGGQNRNQQVAAVLLYAVQNSHLNIIEQKFLESGHSHMECDSMHAAIENAKRYKTAFIMNDWLQIFKGARSKRSKSTQSKNKNTEAKEPYKVIEMKFTDFMDLQMLASTTIRNRNKDEDGNTVSWLKIKCLKFDKAFPQTIFYRYDHSSPYKKILVVGKGRPRKDCAILMPLYKRLLPISKNKKDDLVKLCNSGLIPEELHPWYKNLPTTIAETIERLPEPDMQEIEDDEYE